MELGLQLSKRQKEDAVMNGFQTQRVTDRITRILAHCGELMYLVEGDRRAALLDTGSGVGRLRPVVERLTQKPLTVLITHGHIDHAMGSGEFSEVYMNHLDRYIYEVHGQEALRRATLPLEQGEYIPTAPFSLYHGLKGGDCFDLGGETVEIYDCPGHTRGSVVMLMREERILLTGDACNTYTYLFQNDSTSVDTYERSLRRLLGQVAGKYDRVLSSHGGGELPQDILEGVLQVCQDIKARRVDDVPYSFLGEMGYMAKAHGPDGQRMDGGHGNVIYSREHIWQEWGTV